MHAQIPYRNDGARGRDLWCIRHLTVASGASLTPEILRSPAGKTADSLRRTDLSPAAGEIVDPVFSKILEHSPEIIGILVVVIYFLKAQKELVERFTQIIDREHKSTETLAEHWNNVFDSQRQALNLISQHIKSLGEMLVQHDAWEREISDRIVSSQDKLVSRKIKRLQATQNKS